MCTWFLEELPLMYNQSLIIQPGWGASCPDGGHILRIVLLDMRVLVITSLQAGHLGVSEGDERVKGHRDPTTR